MKSAMMIAVLFYTAVGFANPQYDTAAKDYAAAGSDLMNLINTKDKDIKTKAPVLVKKMTDAATKVIELIAAKEKDPAKKMLSYVITKKSDIEKASFSSLEKDWHDGATVKKDTGFDMMDEANEKYTDPVHALVHPLMTLKAIEGNEGKTLKEAKEELAEGLEQMKGLAKMIK